MTHHYCTYFDRNYLTRGLALIDSLRRTETSDWSISVVCMDEMTHVVLQQLALPNVRLLPLHQIEERDGELLAVKPSRSLVEYYWTLTPTVILRILERNREINSLTYLDADLFFFSSPQPIFDELGHRSILIHEHRFSPRQAHLGTHNGKYNVGLLSFNRTPASFEALRWWRARCLEWCFARTENGKMGDQMYLNDWPTRFTDVAVLTHCGGGIGPWNHDQYRFREDGNGVPWVNDVPALFYHFHSFAQVTPDLALPVKHAHYPLPWMALKLFFIPYLHALECAANTVMAIFPQGTWHLSPDQPVTSQHTVLLRRSQGANSKQDGAPQERIRIDEEWDCLCSAQVLGRPVLSAARHDAAVPSVTSAGSAGVVMPDAPGSIGQRASAESPGSGPGPGQLFERLAAITHACANLSARMNPVVADPAALRVVLKDWARAQSKEPMLSHLIGQLQQRDSRLTAFLPQRVQLALSYFDRPLQDLMAWLGTSNETTNLTYDLTPANTLHLAWMLSLVTATPLTTIQAFLAELDQDQALKDHVRQKTAASPRRLTADADARYGRRAGWYVLVRAMKPKVVVETGVDKGLGTCVLASALLKNRAEGHEGRLYATDIDPTAGFLFTSPYDQVGQIIYGDSIATLKSMSEPIDVFIADSAHTAEYERGEYETVQSRLAPQAILVSDNAHVTQELAHFAEQTGRQFLYFQENPRAHFYPGAGMGIACPMAPTMNATRAMAHAGRVPASADDASQPPVKACAVEDTVASVPLISVLVSAYESEAFMRECLEDLEGQTIADRIEIIVVDAASPQHEGRIVRSFQERYRNIKYIRTPARIGVYAAWNLAITHAQGKYLTPFSTNDRLRPDAYELLCHALDEHPDAALVYGDTYLTGTPHQTFQAHNRIGIWEWPDYDYQLLLKQCCVGPHPMWRRSLHQSVGYFDESYIALGDQDFWIRLGAKHRLMHIPVVTGLYWMSPEGLSNRQDIAGPEEHRLRTTYSSQGTAPAPSPRTMDCSVIIPVWNRCELTRNCLAALAATTTDLSWELVVVDNHSTDGTPDVLSALGGDVRIITNDENLGFAKACNQGAAVATGEYLVFLNNDTIPLNGWLKALVDEVRTHPDVSVVGSKLLYEDGSVQHAGVAIDRHNLTPYHIYKGFAGDHPAVNKRRELNAVTGACLLIRRSVFTDIGGFDEGFINGFEDVDLCLKVREKRGRIVYQPHSVLYHLESQTPGRKQHDQLNATRLHQRWGHCWWLVDDDSIYAGDGYKAIEGDQNGIASYTLHLIDSTQERQAWDLVASLQQAAHRQDLAMVEAVLKRPAEWPADSSVLQWAAAVAMAMKLPSIAEEYRRRVECLNDPAFRELEQIRAALAGGQLSAAASRVDALLQQQPTHAEALLLRAILHMQRGQYREAEIAFTTALNQGAHRKKCLMGLGMASMGRAYPQGAWQTFLRVLAENPDDADVIHWLLRAGTAQNRWRELSVQLHNYLARNPSDVSVRFAYAGVLLRGDQVDAARQEYDQLRALAPTYEGLVELGQAIAGKESVLAMNVSNA